MALDLESLKQEIQTYLENSDIAVFYGYHRTPDTLTQVAWDKESHPDFRDFIATARKAGAKLIVFTHIAFSLDQIDNALEQLEGSELTREQKRNFETNLRQLKKYEGFTCSLELSFLLENQMYLFELNTEWFDAMNDLLSELDFAIEPDDDEVEDDSLGGYFSKN